MRITFLLLALIVVVFGCLQPTESTPEQAIETPVEEGDTIQEKTVNSGDTIKVDYIGKLENGEIFDESTGKQPLQFTVGSGQVIKGFDDGVLGLKVGETKTVNIPPKEAYGDLREDQITEVPLSQFGDQAENLSVGLVVSASNGASGKIVEIHKDTNTVKIDFNHALAGKTLIFDITLREILE